MAIIFGNISGTGGGTGNLWKFQTTSPVTEIMLNDTAGVTGIRAPLPTDNDLELRFDSPAPGVIIGGFGVYETVDKIMYSAVQKSGGVKIAGNVAQNVATGAISLVYSKFDSLGNPISGWFNSDAVNSENRFVIEASQTDLVIEDTTTNDKSVSQVSVSAKEFSVYKAAVEVFRFRIDENGLAVYNNSGANLLFQIADTGEILTNQTQAATGADNTIIGRLPVYDEAGILIGYCPLMVDP